MGPDAAVADAARKRIATACEACRVTKVRCRPSELPDVCQKCLALKRECISRTCPRPRRSRKTLESQESSSSTFTIDFTVPASPEPDNGIDSLRDSHVQHLEKLFPDDGLLTDQWASPWAADAQTPDTLSAQPSSRSIHEGHVKPLFNLASAESLLHSFRRTRLEHLPCIVLPTDASVPHLAATQPFVLLAILAASSGSKTLQGHGLYDEEFRRVLGCKFVAGCERSLELLQGILIYSAWYPFHLRPGDTQGLKYLPMAADIIRDLELAPELPVDADVSTLDPTDRQLDGLRAYLTYVHLSSTRIVSWKSKSSLPNLYSSSTLKYCDVFESNARVEGDAVLAALCRNSCVLYEAFQVIHEHGGQQNHHRRLILSGLGSRLAETKARVLPMVASSAPFILQCNLIDLYLDCGSLLRLPRAKRHCRGDGGALPLLPAKMYDCVIKLRMLLDGLAVLDDGVFLRFTLDDWVRLILAVVLSLRLSFPMPECPEFDTAWARAQLQFDHFLDRMCGEMESAPTSKNHDVLSASRVILRIVYDKYRTRLRALEEGQAPPLEKANGCPMFDSYLEPFLPLWDAGLGQPSPVVTMPSGFGEEAAVPPSVPPSVFHDVWATMTVNWAGYDND